MLVRETNVPVAPNPIVESTVIIESLISTGLITLVFGCTSNVPSINALSLYPTNSPIL